MVNKSRNLVAVFATLLLVLGMTSSALAHAIDYTAYDIQPQYNFDGKSGNFRLIEPVPAGGIFSFNLTLELIESAGGGTSALPVTVTFGVKNSVPHDLMVRFGYGATLADIAALPATINHKYDKVSNLIASLQTRVMVVAPATPGSYFFKIQALSGFKGLGLQPGEGIVIHFKVPESVAQPVETVLNVDLASSSVIYRAPSNPITATITEKNTGNPVAGEAIDFYVDGEKKATVTTGLDGKATFGEYDPSSLNVGDYSVQAKFQGTGSYISSSGSTNQCVTYKFCGFQPPVLVQQTSTSGLGIGLFQGKVIPVKIKIADYYDAPVTNAQCRVYFAQTVVGAAEVQAVAIQPTIAEDGSLMRYDPAADQYILNWNIATLPNGDYNIRIGMEEGECATGHWCPVRIGKAGK